MTVDANDPRAGLANSDPLAIRVWPRLLTIDMAARYLGLSAKTIRNHGNLLPGKRSWGGKVVFDRHEIDRMLDKARGIRSLWIDAERACR